MEYEVKQDQASVHDWRVEAIDHESEGECYVTIFSGQRAEERAREYAEWKTAVPDPKEPKCHSNSKISTTYAVAS